MEIRSYPDYYFKESDELFDDNSGKTTYVFRRNNLNFSAFTWKNDAFVMYEDFEFLKYVFSLKVVVSSKQLDDIFKYRGQIINFNGNRNAFGLHLLVRNARIPFSYEATSTVVKVTLKCRINQDKIDQDRYEKYLRQQEAIRNETPNPDKKGKPKYKPKVINDDLYYFDGKQSNKGKQSLVFERRKLTLNDFTKTDEGYVFEEDVNIDIYHFKYSFILHSDNIEDILACKWKAVRVSGTPNNLKVTFRMNNQHVLPLNWKQQYDLCSVQFQCKGKYLPGKRPNQKQKGSRHKGRFDKSIYAVKGNTWGVSHPYQGGLPGSKR